MSVGATFSATSVIVTVSCLANVWLLPSSVWTRIE